MDSGIPLGDYRLGNLLRRRGLASTYRAVDERSGEEVAVRSVPASPESRKHLAREFAIGSRLSHPNLLRYYQLLVTEGETALVTDLVEGEALLAALSRSEPRSLGPRTRRAFRQLCETVEYLHGQGLVHANLCPSVILWTSEAILRFIDLGHCVEIFSGQDPWAGQFHGTPLYSSPEHGRCPLVEESDYFVIGILLVEHLTGAHPCLGHGERDADSLSNVLGRIGAMDELLPALHFPPLPPGLRDIMASLLSAAPVERCLGFRRLVALLG